MCMIMKRCFRLLCSKRTCCSGHKHCLLVVTCLMFFSSIYAYDAEVDGIYYNFLGDEAIVTYYDNIKNFQKYKGVIVIPPAITYASKTYTITTIGENAFAECANLNSIRMEDGIIRIGDYAFYKCSKLDNVSIPNTVTSIGNYVFDGCRNMANITLSSSIDYIGVGLFKSCGKIESMIIPDNVVMIDAEAFFQCSKMTSITLSERLEHIGGSAFLLCSSLTAINIPHSVTTIFGNAFAYCDGLTSVTSEIIEPYDIDESVFTNVYSQATLTVPKGTKAVYISKNGWKNFFHIVEGDGTYVNSIFPDEDSYDVYDIYGHKVLSKTNSIKGLQRNVYIIKGHKTIKKLYVDERE